MTDLRQAAQQALEALKISQDYVQASANAKLAAGWGEQLDRAEKAITALRTALEQQQAEPPSPPYTLDSTKAAVVATEFYWLPIDGDTPRGVKILLLGRGGVASLGHYHHKPGESEFWTHWAPLPKRRPE